MPTRAHLAHATLALTSGILLALALPPSHHGWIAWFALVPCLTMRRHVSPVMLLPLCLLMVVPSASTQATMLGVSTLGFRYALAAVVGVPFLFGLAAAAGLTLERQIENRTTRALVFPCLTVAVEALLQTMLPGLPVPSLAWTQTPDSVLIQSGLALASPLPVTFLIVLTNVGIEEGSDWLLHSRRGSWRTAPLPVATALAALLFTANVIYGVARSSGSSEPVGPSTGNEKEAES